jgi:hypothetical protein
MGVLAELKCPLTITKSQLSVPGAPGATAPLLAALYWVICLVKVISTTWLTLHLQLSRSKLTNGCMC